MRRLSVLIAIAALFVVALPVASVGAAPPEGVTFTGGASFAGTGDFVATGPAVDSGAVCDTGRTTDVPGTATMSGQSPNGTNLRIVKEFTCGDGSGSFFVKLRVRIHNPGDTTFKWVIKGGTGTYANLKGNGTGFGTPLIPPVAPDFYDVFDTYTGKLH